MVKRRNSFRRRFTGRRRGNVFNRIRRRNLPVMRLSNIPKYRNGPGTGKYTATTTASMLLAPRKLSSWGPSGQWWFESIVGVAFALMKFFVIAQTQTATDKITGSAEGYASGLVFSCCQVIKFGAEQLLAVSPFVHRGTTASEGYTSLFGMIRLRGVKFTITPDAVTSHRGGHFIAAIVPRHLSESDNELTFDDVAMLPGAIRSRTDRPVTVHYSPVPQDISYIWRQIGEGTYDLKLYCAFQDNSSNSTDQSAAYSLDESSFEVNYRGSFEVKEQSSTYIKITPFPTPEYAVDKLTVLYQGRHRSLSINKLLSDGRPRTTTKWHNIQGFKVSDLEDSDTEYDIYSPMD